MLGVVLWADIDDRKAVIWCEDHGNLAYYTAAEQRLSRTYTKGLIWMRVT